MVKKKVIEAFYNPIIKKSKSKLWILILLLVIALAGAVYLYLPKDCGSDRDCFIQKAQTCSKARVADYKEGNEFIALLPVSGKYVMDAEEAAEAALLIKPTLAIPMHYGSGVGTIEDARKFVELCLREGIRAEILEKI